MAWANDRLPLEFEKSKPPGGVSFHFCWFFYWSWILAVENRTCQQNYEGIKSPTRSGVKRRMPYLPLWQVYSIISFFDIVYFPLLSFCVTWLLPVLVSSCHMWQSIFFYLSNHHYVYSVSGRALYRIPPWSIVSDLSLAGFLNTLLEVVSQRTALYTYHLPVSSSWGFPEKEQRSCNEFPKHQQSPLDTC